MKETKEYKRKDSMYFEAWRKLKKNRTAMLGLLIICVAIFISVLGANIRPDPTEDANNQNSPISRKAPGFKVNQLLARKNREFEDVGFFGKLFFGYEEAIYKNYPMYGYKFEGGDIVIEEYTGFENDEDYEVEYQSYSLADVLYPLSISREEKFKLQLNGTMTIWLIDGTEITRSVKEMREEIVANNVVNQTFYLGTDKLGRDMLSRLMAGTIISLSVGLIAVIISLIIGLLLGSLAGFYRGWVDDLIMWFINMVWSIPGLLLIISLTLILGKGFTTVFIAVGLIMWVELARVVRGQILSIREQEYVEAVRALGYSNARIIWKHVLPNIMGPVIVISSANFASAILIEAGLSFLGIGAQIPMASWGAMLEQHKSYMMTTGNESAFLAILPGISIIILVFAFMLLGNGLRDALDTKSVDGVTGT
jgi:peptide/nickel transport system permease protein